MKFDRDGGEYYSESGGMGTKSPNGYVRLRYTELGKNIPAKLREFLPVFAEMAELAGSAMKSYNLQPRQSSGMHWPPDLLDRKGVDVKRARLPKYKTYWI